MTENSLTRREVLASLASLAVLPLLSACGGYTASPPVTTTNPDADALALLDDIANNLLNLFPESATSLGIDVGARAGLRSRLTDRSAEGKVRIARQVRADLDRLNAFHATSLSYSTRTSIDVVRSAYTTAL